MAPLMRAAAVCWVGVIVMLGASFTSCGFLIHAAAKK